VQYRGYRDIYLDSCRQGNMSTRYTHPNLVLDDTPYTVAEIRDAFRSYVPKPPFRRDGNLPSIPRALAAIVFPWIYTRTRPQLYLENESFRFENLPVDIQCRVWKLLIPNGELIHCLSRLDPNCPPLDWTPENSGFPSRFHIGKEKCSIAKAHKPFKFFKFCHVSSRWYYVTTHLFYGRFSQKETVIQFFRLMRSN
jgi:hypothetical protein